jgi:hypothetical protein
MCARRAKPVSSHAANSGMVASPRMHVALSRVLEHPDAIHEHIDAVKLLAPTTSPPIKPWALMPTPRIGPRPSEWNLVV